MNNFILPAFAGMTRSLKGFTLIEVLVALAILSIALTAIIRTSSQNIKNTLYLQNKTVAAWVATEVINEAQINLIKIPAAPDKVAEKKEMFNQKWRWQASLALTPNPHIKKIIVSVLDKNETQLVEMQSYVYSNQ